MTGENSAFNSMPAPSVHASGSGPARAREAPTRAAAVVVCLLVLAALLAQQSVAAIDAVSALLALVAWARILRCGESDLSAAALLGAAGGLCPLALGASVGLLVPRARSSAMRFSLAMVVAIVVYGARLAGRGYVPGLFGWGGPAHLDRLAAPNLWTEVVGRLDPLTPLLLLSVIGISVSLYRWSQERGETAGALGMAVAWLIINVAVLLVQPRYVVGHLLVWALPAALWVSRGWSSFMRVLLTPSVFVRAVGLAFTFLLAIWLWLPLRAIRDAILIALQATL